MGLTVLGVVLFFVMGGPGALQTALLDRKSILLPSDPLNLENAGEAGADANSGAPNGPGRTLEIVTLLPPDGIPAILNPQLICVAEATSYDDDEPVLGVSINGDSRAYSLPFLSGREVVNDIVRGILIAVTW
jgi:hypothetical protein